MVSARGSPVRVCFTGNNRAGSWEIRGRQIAATRSTWHAAQHIEKSDIDRFDLFCFVKRPQPEVMARVREAGKPIVLDVIDSWAQPDDGLKHTDLASARRLFAAQWQALPPIDAFIFPNRTMQRDLAPLVRSSIVIYHHYWPDIGRNPVRPDAATVGYEGNVGYLGEWHAIVADICRHKGMQFVTNPDSLTAIDIGFAARGGSHASFLAHRYKSNVKLANCYGSGTPCAMSHRDWAAHETDCGDVRFFATAAQLERQIEALRGHDLRLRIHEAFRRAATPFHIDRIADTFEQFFVGLMRRHAAGAAT